MSWSSKRVFKRLYGSASTPADLPWHEPDPPALLVKALDARPGPGRALDVGCGAGAYSLYMASRGHAVAGIDYMPEAIELLRAGAQDTGHDITAVQADVRTWTAEQPFDVVLDVGCLHSLSAADRKTYRQQLLRWLAPGGDYILVHLGRRAWWDAWPVGPNRIYKSQLVELFAPELELHESEAEEKRGLPLLIGGSMLTMRYWFKRGA
ncbi:MAG: class I SAM-dependent methyltransferase [Gammaproteobacteria bacterium]|nr:class I SAM-dependent methyltransferase [Gammaproteobacteria bacterium]